MNATSWGAIAQAAGNAIEAWAEHALASARQRLGIQSNHEPLKTGADFDGAMVQLERFLTLGLTHEGLLRQALTWLHLQCLRENQKKDSEAMRVWIRRAKPFVDALARLVVKGDRGNPSCVAVAKHFVARSVVGDDRTAAIADLREALAWNPDDANARSLLDELQA